MLIDLHRVRADTPGTQHRNHMNNAGAALMPVSVIDTVTGHFRREACQIALKGSPLIALKAAGDLTARPKSVAMKPLPKRPPRWSRCTTVDRHAV